MGRGYRVLAYSLILLSVAGSLGASIETVETFRQSRLADSHSVIQTNAEVQSLDRQIVVLLGRLSELSPRFVSAGKALSDELDKLRADRARLIVSLGRGLAVTDHSTMLDLMARVSGIPTETLMLTLLVFLSINLEAAALVLSGHNSSVGHRPTEQLVTAFGFLEAAKDGVALPVLHGRDVTAKKLGISYYHAKRLVRELKESGIIHVVGKRLVLKPQP